MKIRCKGCRKKISLAAAGTAVGIFIIIILFIIIISVIIGAIIISVYLTQKANNEWAFEHVLERTDFENANSGFGNRFEITRVYSESAYPNYVTYLTYDGEPEDFINESVALCDMLYCSYSPGESRNNYRDELSFKLSCGKMKLAFNRSRYAETNILFDYSELE